MRLSRKWLAAISFPLMVAIVSLTVDVGDALTGPRRVLLAAANDILVVAQTVVQGAPNGNCLINNNGLLGSQPCSVLINAATYAPGITIGDGNVHTVGNAPAGTPFYGVTTLAGLAAITINGVQPFYFLTDSGTITGPLCTFGASTNCFLNGTYSLTNSSVANMDIAWLAIQAALLQGKAYVPAGTYIIGSSEVLPLMIPTAPENNGSIVGQPTTLLGDGARLSVLLAGNDFGAGNPLLVCGDPAGTSVNTLGRYNGNNGMCVGDVVRIGLFKPSGCAFYPTPGTTACGMTGFASGARLRDLDIESDGFGVDMDWVGDFTQHIRTHLLGGVKGLRLNTPNSTLFGAQQWLSANFSGQSFASISVAPYATLSGQFNAQTYLSGMYGIFGESASGGGCTAITNVLTFDNLFMENIGNESIVDDTGFGSQTSSLTATNASPAVFTGTANVYYNGNKVVLSGGTAPAGFTLGSSYFVVNATPGSGTFNLATSRGGSAINSTSTGSGFSGTSGVYTDANKCRNISETDMVQFQNSFYNNNFDTTGSGRGRRATFDVNQISINLGRMIVNGMSLTPNAVAATYGPPAVAFINAKGIGDSYGDVNLAGDVTGLVSQLGTLQIAAGDTAYNDYANITLQSGFGWTGSVGQFQSVGTYTTTVVGDIFELGQYGSAVPGGTNLAANSPAIGVALQGGMTNAQNVPYANSGIFNVNMGWNTTGVNGVLVGKSTGINKTLTVVGGTGYSNGGPYTWTATGGGCSTEPIGTVSVSGGALTGATIGATTQGIGCTSTPTIPIPGGAGAGSGGSITAKWPSGNGINFTTPITAGFLGVAMGGNNSVGGGGNYLTTRLQGLR